jgi:hypothetical protein
MTFEFDDATRAYRAAAETCARDVIAPAAAEVDALAAVPAPLRAAARAALAPPADPVAWTITLEALATASAATALAAAAETLALPDGAGAGWTGLRGIDVDRLAAPLAASAPGSLAVTAALIGTGRAAVEASVAALKATKAAGQPVDVASPVVSDAATALEASRLLLWDAARLGEGDAATTARALARVHALEAVPLAFRAAAAAIGAEAFRPGAPIERARRDAATLADVLGEAAPAMAAAASGTLPG